MTGQDFRRSVFLVFLVFLLACAVACGIAQYMHGGLWWLGAFLCVVGAAETV